MSSFYNDGSYNYGSLLLPITGSVSGSYVSENFTVNYPSDVIEIRNQLNAPAGWIGVSGFIGGSTTVQIGSGQGIPVNGSVFGALGHVFVLSEVGDNRTQGDIAKASVSFRKKYN